MLSGRLKGRVVVFFLTGFILVSPFLSGAEKLSLNQILKNVQLIANFSAIPSFTLSAWSRLRNAFSIRPSG